MKSSSTTRCTQCYHKTLSQQCDNLVAIHATRPNLFSLVDVFDDIYTHWCHDYRSPRFNEAEVSLDEMDSGTSAYMKEDLLKRKFMATWQKLCGVVGISPEIEICTDEISLGYTKTPYPEINRRVTRLLRCNEFPDHYDIVELIERCNTKHVLGISVEEKAQLSREVFKDIGKILKSQRARDFKVHFGSHLTDDALKKSEDPASLDSSLLDMLKQSLKEGQEKLEQLCEKFVFKQEMESEQEKSQDGDTCESEDNDEEEEEEEDEREEGEEIDIEGVSVDVEEVEGEERDEILVGAIKSDKGGSNETTPSRSCDVVSSSDDDDVDGDETENTRSRSSDEESDISTPVELASTLSSPFPTDTTSLDDDRAQDYPGSSVSHRVTIKRPNEDGEYPSAKKMRKLHTKTNSCEGNTQDNAGNEKRAISPAIYPTITTATTAPTVILLDDDSDVIVLSD